MSKPQKFCTIWCGMTHLLHKKLYFYLGGKERYQGNVMNSHAHEIKLENQLFSTIHTVIRTITS